MIRYYKLFDLLNRREMKKTELLKVISAPTLGKLQKGEIVKSDTIDKICLFLDCQPNDIMEVFQVEEYEIDGEKIENRTLAGAHQRMIDEYSEEERLEKIRKQMQKYEK